MLASEGAQSSSNEYLESRQIQNSQAIYKTNKGYQLQALIKIEINNLYIKDIFVHNYFYNCFRVPLPKSHNTLTLLT